MITVKENNSIFVYCFKRMTTKGAIHFIPLIINFDGFKTLMASWDLLLLQDDYDEDLKRYRKKGYALYILELPFHKYILLKQSITNRLNNKPSSDEDLIKNIKTQLLFAGISPAIPNDVNDFSLSLFAEKEYCKCIDKSGNIVECENYLPFIL